MVRRFADLSLDVPVAVNQPVETGAPLLPHDGFAALEPLLVIRIGDHFL
jgi:hypothetical protein